MAISYNNLWKTLIDKGINKSELCKKVKISTSTMAKMTNGEPVNLSTLESVMDKPNFRFVKADAKNWIVA